MGQSTNAIMAFGFDLGEELPESFTYEDEDGEFEMDKFLAQDFGIDMPEWTPGVGSEFFDKERAAISKIPVEIIDHCSGDYPMHFLAVRGTENSARRGYPEKAPQRPIEQSEIDALRAFCEKHDIEWQEPCWHIFSMWN